MKYNINFMNMLKLLLVVIGIFLIVRILNVKNNKIKEGFDVTKNEALVLDVNHLEGELKINDNRQAYLDGLTNIINMAELSKLKELIAIEQSDLTKDNLPSNIDEISKELNKYDNLIESLKKTQEYINDSDGGGGIF